MYALHRHHAVSTKRPQQHPDRYFNDQLACVASQLAGGFYHSWDRIFE